ncbi:ABC transporter permease [Benzoatithermus flavus]|uniref:ABC transporter permease n=1 Tax=Benzoatithermus flavus TaxID=3108223 RepID=A0ABU8XLW3_9PROT
MRTANGRRPFSFYVLTAVFVLFVLFLYGPMTAIYILSFQGPTGGLTFPMRGFSLHWFEALFGQERTGDFAGAFERSLILALLATVLTLVISLSAGLAFRKRFVGASVVFYMAIASLVMPGVFVGLGIAIVLQILKLTPVWWLTGLGAHLTWTLPFGLLIMFAIFNRFNRAYEEAARDLGASSWRTLTEVTIPILAPGLIGVALFGFTLSYDEFPRSVLTVGAKNTLPLEVFAMTNTVTTPSVFALGTLTTAVSFLIISAALASIVVIQRRRSGKAGGGR